MHLHNDDPTRIVIPSSGESHQQDELSPLNKVVTFRRSDMRIAVLEKAAAPAYIVGGENHA